MLLLVLLACLLAAPAWAQDPAPRAGRAAPAPLPSNPGTTATERWVWEEVRAGRTANLHARCGVRLDPHRAEDARWGDDCRRLTAGFLERVLTSEGWRAAPAHRGVSIVGARVAEPLDLAAARVEMEVWLDESRFDRDVTLFGARFEGSLSLQGSAFEGGVAAGGLRVGGALFLRNATFSAAPEIIVAEIGGDLDISGADLPGLDLAGSTIKGELRLASPRRAPPRGRDDAWLVLRNLRVGAVADRQDAVGRNISWPARLELQGFAYDRLGGYTGGGQRDMLLRDPGYYTELLARDPTFSRQPYQQLAGVFRAAGDADRADAVLYAARDREMMANWRAGDCRHGLGLLLLNGDCWSAAGLAVLKATIGYGLGGGYWLALAWVGFFTVAGVLVLRASPAARARGLGWRLGASLDRLLPIIELNKEFGDFFDDPKRRRLKGWQLAYFSAHAVAGYVLAAFVAAGLAGLTQAQ